MLPEADVKPDISVFFKFPTISDSDLREQTFETDIGPFFIYASHTPPYSYPGPAVYMLAQFKCDISRTLVAETAFVIASHCGSAERRHFAPRSMTVGPFAMKPRCEHSSFPERKIEIIAQFRT